ncbi:hypothetical protein MPL1_11388 [Methylophaga lonarensis MPL]|uniref:Flp pilus-assembly TadG-like N-terminal domain-containing protein n=1 Tax=Methylophaga lonarensis MPL TaxID=1286106 RepID=M7PP34_9GAMM|nr:TadG family pilus assembly protein [Methylophaga lonarensis]EMR12219.1 hypothetical protein MPL1_11388 [Methylophaga lonarensis MPL]
MKLAAFGVANARFKGSLMSGSHPQYQRGAIGLLGILTLLLAVLFAALVIDTGRLMLEQRRLQMVADMAVLDASSGAGHCGDGSLQSAQLLAQQSAANHHHMTQPSDTLDVRLGTLSTGAGGLRQFVDSNASMASAVRVTAGRSVPASFFAGGLLGNDVTLSATAVAERRAIAGFSAGSMLLGLSDSDAALLNLLLTGILGSPVNLSLLSYQGIASTQISLADLVSASATAGSVEQLLNTNMNVAELLHLYADAVGQGAADVAVIAAMQSLAAASVDTLNLTIGDLLDVTTDSPEQAAEADINLLDLLTTTALVANGGQALLLPLDLTLPGIASISSQLTVTEPPQIAIGPPLRDSNGEWRTRVQTAQIEMQTLIQGDINLNVAGLIGARATVDLALQLAVAQGSAWLQQIQCSSLQTNHAVVTIGTQPGIADLRMTRASDSGATMGRIDVSAQVLLLGQIPVARVDVGLGLPLHHSGGVALVYGVDLRDADALPMVQTASTDVGASLENLSGSLTTDVTLLGVLPVPLLDQLIVDALLSQLLAPILVALAQTTVDPLLSVLGIDGGAISVQLFSVEMDRPDLMM